MGFLLYRKGLKKKPSPVNPKPQLEKRHFSVQSDRRSKYFYRLGEEGARAAAGDAITPRATAASDRGERRVRPRCGFS